MPVLALNRGRIRPNSPESCVEVVEETTIDFSAKAGETASRATKVPITVSSRDITRNPPFGWKSHVEITNAAGEPPCFAEIVRRWHSRKGSPMGKIATVAKGS